MSDAWLVVGLGNPGPGYAGHRHNVGFQVLDLLADRVGGRFKSHKGRADVVEARLGPHRVVLAKPRSYMNESGGRSPRSATSSTSTWAASSWSMTSWTSTSGCSG